MSNQSLHEYAIDQGYETYYDVLGVDEDAAPEEIDVQKQQIMAEVLSNQTSPRVSLAKEAANELLNPTKRETYDSIGHEAYVQDEPRLTSFGLDPSPDRHTNSSNNPDPTQSPSTATPDPETETETKTDHASTYQSKGIGVLTAILPNRETVAQSQTWLLAQLGDKFIRSLRWLSKTVRGDKDGESGISGYYYPADSILEKEEVIAKTNPTRWQSAGPYSLGIIFYIFAVLSIRAVQTGYLYQYVNTRLGIISIQQSNIPFWWTFPLFCILMGTAIIFAEMLQRASTWYILTDNRVFIREHPLSRRTSSLKIHQLSKSEEESPFPITLFNIGHVDLYTSASGDREERLWYLANSNDFKNELASVEDKSSRQQAKPDPPKDAEPSS